jgi:transcriptional regulator with XRE-family HTH domain
MRPPVDIGKRVRSRRNALDLTQEDVAGELGVTHQHISRIERDEAVPSLDTLIKLARVLGTSADFLLTGHDQAPRDAAAAIRSEAKLSPAAKKHLVGLVRELSR